MRNGLFILALAAVSAFGQSAELERAKKLYDRTQYSAALNLLKETDNSAAAQFLIGRCHFMLGDHKKASEAFEKAVAADPKNSHYYDWLGKAFGRRAEVASPFTAPGYATKARSYFEKAVELDNRNIEAVNDLMEYYLEAPSFLGGGIDKASRLAGLIEKYDPVEYHFALANIAERRKDAKTAESHLRRAMELAPAQVSRVIDLAKFLSKQGRAQESETLFVKAESMAPEDPKVLFEHASALIKFKKDLPNAKAMLEKYIKSANVGPDDPPKSEAQKLLASVKGA